MKGPVAIDAGDRFFAVLDRVAPTWPRRAATGKAGWLVRVRRHEDGYRIDTSWADDPTDKRSTVTAVCAFLVDLVYAGLERSELTCLHCAAVDTDGGLVVFPNTYRAGKSTLVTALAASGLRVHADDLMPIAPTGEGIALGINPRLRRPLPDDAPRWLDAFVANHAGPANARYQYVELPEPLLSPHGCRRPIRAIVILRRGAGAAAIEPVAEGDGARHLILQHFRRGGDSRDTLERLLAIVGPIPSYVLDYGNLDAAVGLLKRTFAGPRKPARRAPSRSAVAVPTGRERPAPTTGRMPAGKVRRRRDVALRTTGSAAFLAAPDAPGIFELNPVGRAVWEVLAHPRSPEEVADVLAAAFPDTSRKTILVDVADLLRRLWKAGLIRRAGRP